MVVALAPRRTEITSPWLDWLTYWAEVRWAVAGNKSKLAAYLEIDRNTVSAWYTRGTRPSYANVIQTADRLKRPRNEALAAAEYEVETVAPALPSEPRWVITLIDSIVNVDPPLTPAEARMVEAQVRGLLQVREERGPYAASPAEDPEHPRQP